MAEARLLLEGPKAQKPSDRRLLKAAASNTQSMFNQLSNTGKAWEVDETTITTSPDTEEYVLTPVNIGKPLLVKTIDESNPSHREREISFFEVQNLDFDWGLPNDFGNFVANVDGSLHTAARVAFIRKSGAMYARFKPVPKQSAEYRVLYAIGNWIDSAALDDAPVLSEHHHLIEVRTALSVLPGTEWSDDKDDNRERRAELFNSLSRDEARFAADFEKYIQSLRQDRMSFRVGVDFD